MDRKRLPRLSLDLLGPEGVAKPGAFYIEVAPSAPRDAVEPFVAWPHEEASRDARSPRRKAVRAR